jgi:predicted nucleotidyltransferase
MKMSKSLTNHGLTTEQVAVLRTILQPYKNHIEQVGLFGSRATGTFRPESDIDLVVYGSIDAAAVDRLQTLFNDSLLPVDVDVQAYHLIAYPPLQVHIDAVVQPLFTQDDLS